MTTIPAKVKERRDDLLRHRQSHLDEMQVHEQELRMCRSELAAIDGEINGIDLTVSAYLEEGAAPQQAVEVKAPRAPRRDVRGMVLDAVKSAPHGASASALSEALGVRLQHIKEVLEYWRDKGDITLRGDVARVPGTVDDILAPFVPAQPAPAAQAAADRLSGAAQIDCQNERSAAE